jgi:hypothetical protein
MTDIIYDRAAVREQAIWTAFSYNGPFGTLHNTERATLFGLYANTYLHGQNYLNDIETEDLSRLVDTYTNNMAKLTNDEAQTVLEIAAKRYIETITMQMHDEDMITREQKIDALDAEYDAKTEALDADYAALETQRQKVELAWKKADQRIKELEARTEIEAVNYSMVDIDISEKELQAARADLAVIEAGLKGLDIQLAITEVAIQSTNTDLQITEAETRVDEIGVQVAEIEVQKSGVDLDVVNAGISLSKSQAAGEKTKSDTQGVAVRVAEIGVQVSETEAKESQYTADIAKINSDISRLGLVDSELIIANANNRITQAENELLIQEEGLINSQKANVKAETVFVENHKDIQEALDDKTLAHDQGEHDFSMTMSQQETEFEDDLNTIKTDALDSRKELVDNTKVTKIQDAEDRTELDDIRADAAEYYAQAAIQAAQDMATANIMNTLTHSIR